MINDSELGLELAENDLELAPAVFPVVWSGPLCLIPSGQDGSNAVGEDGSEAVGAGDFSYAINRPRPPFREFFGFHGWECDMQIGPHQITARVHKKDRPARHILELAEPLIPGNLDYTPGRFVANMVNNLISRTFLTPVTPQIRARMEQGVHVIPNRKSLVAAFCSRVNGNMLWLRYDPERWGWSYKRSAYDPPSNLDAQGKVIRGLTLLSETALCFDPGCLEAEDGYLKEGTAVCSPEECGLENADNFRQLIGYYLAPVGMPPR